MSKDADLIPKLKELGFSEYAAKVYIAVVKIGQGTAPAIAKKADVPQSKVYSVLDDLYDDGWVGIEKTIKGKGKDISVYSAHRPLERFTDWLQDFVGIAEYLDSLYGTAISGYEHGYYSVGNFTGKLEAKDYIYIFDQSENLLVNYIEGKIVNYYRLGAKPDSLMAINKERVDFLIEKENRVQFISINEPIFYKVIEMVFTLSPENRIITGDMAELSGDENILFVDSIRRSSGAVTAQHGTLWLTEKRIFIQAGASITYARPLYSLDVFEVDNDGSLLLVVKTKDGLIEQSNIYTYSDPILIVNLINLINNRKK